MIGLWTFRIGTSLLPLLGVLEEELRRHAVDPYLLAASAIGCAAAFILHYGRAQSDPPAGA